MKPSTTLAKHESPPKTGEFKWESITALSTSVLALVTLLALGFTGWQIRDYRDEIRVQRLVEEVRVFESSDYVAIRRSLAKQRLDSAGNLKPLNAADPPREMYSLLDYYEHLGVLEKRGYLDADDVWEEFSYTLLNFYSDSKPVIEAEQRDDPNSYRNLDKLAVVVRAIDVRNHGKHSNPTGNEIKEFYKYEENQPQGAPIAKQR